jgi:DNA invertase Pin-like site-specific DNA recombinase
MMTPKKTKAPATAAVYVRISKDRTGAGLGVGRQTKACQEWADEHGWTVAEVYSDDDLSAYSGKPRPAYKRMLEDIREGRRDGLIAWHNDRLTRHPRELEDLVEVVEASGVPIGTVTAGDFDLGTVSGKMVARLLGAVARGEAEHNAERLQLKHLELAEKGAPSGGGGRRFGFEDDALTIRQSEAKLIREAAARIMEGETLRAIAKDWNARGVQTVSGVPWESTTIKRLMMAARLSGQREHHGRIVGLAQWDAILTPEETTKLRAILTDERRNQFRDRAGSTYTLAGLMYCGECGARMICRPMHRKNGTKFRRYYCSIDRGGCNKVGISAERTEAHVLDELAVRALSATEPDEDYSDEVLAERATLLGRRDNFARRHAAGEIDDSEWSAYRDEITRRLAALEESADGGQAWRTPAWPARLKHVQGGVGDLRRHLHDWDGSHEELRSIVRAYAERVEITRSLRSGRGAFDPDRITITWRI